MREVTPAEGAAPPHRWRLALLGEAVELTGPGTLWHPGTSSALLLAYLSLEGPTARERLAGMLWPERPEARARANLRQLLLRIRAVAPMVDGDPLRLAPEVWVDARDLPDGALADAASDRLLAGLDASRLPALAEWLAGRQEEHVARLRRILTGRLAAARERSDLATAALAAERLARLEPWSESACRTVMEVALARDEPATALRAFRRLRHELATQLAAEPAAATVELARSAARAAAGAVQREPASPARFGASVPPAADGRGWLREGVQLLRTVAAGLDGGAELARALTELAWLEHRLGWNARAREDAERALGLLRSRPRQDSERAGEAGDAAQGVADACFVLGSLAWAGGDLARARANWADALRALRQDDDTTRLRLNLDLARVEDALERPEAARPHYAAALALARSTGERGAESEILNNLGVQLARDGRASDALALLRRARAIARARGDRLLEGYILDSIAEAYLAAARGDPRGTAGPDQASAGRSGVPGDTLAAARAAAAQAVTVAMEAGDVRLQIEALLTLAGASLTAGDGRAAARFARAAGERADAAGWAPLAGAARAILERATAGGGVTPA